MAQYSYTYLDLPLAREVAIFRAFEQVLRDDAILSATVRTWATWRGEAIDLQAPTFGMCPYLKMLQGQSSYDPATEIQHHTPQQIQLILGTVGTNLDNLGNLFGAVREALFPQNNPTLRDVVRATLMNVGVTRPTLKLSAMTTNTDDAAQPFLIGVGVIEFNAFIGT